MKDPLTIDPARMEESDWSAVRDYLAAAASAGEVVEISSRIESITPAEAAKRLGMSRSTISRRITSGEIRTIKVGSHHRIPTREFERFHDAVMARLVEASSADIEAELCGD